MPAEGLGWGIGGLIGGTLADYFGRKRTMIFAILAYSGYLKAKDKDELAPGLRIPTGTPPIFLTHGGDDIISNPDHSIVMYQALKRAGVSAELHIYGDTAHDFGVRPSDRPCSTWTQSCAQWLRQQGFLKGSSGP